jgi:hypothetical protein
VIFETFVMPVVVFGFFVSQVGLYIEHVTLKPETKKRKKARNQG